YKDRAFPRNRQKKHRKIATFPMFHSFFTARGLKGINYFRFFDASVLSGENKTPLCGGGATEHDV
ncbi:MAG: hypothetical protein IJ584_04145, partial [Bacteroidales bacterium]|nr:hypothetical protein [Bacteroidales bacterium]